MKHLLAYLFLFGILFSIQITYNTTYAQTLHIEGSVIDTNSTKGIKDAKAILIRLKDSIIVSHQNTDEHGKFEFKNLPIDTFRLVIEHYKYETREFYFFSNENNYDFSLFNMVLSDRGKKIDEVTIFAYKDPIHYKGDTLIYIADSFKTRPNAVVEDLLKKLPGITVDKDGSIKSQGKEISRVYVDGDEFFGSDATLATKNLSANSVERVQVYETDLPDASSSDEKVKILDLRLKDEAKKGYFGKVAFGTDFMNYYEGQALFNHFSKKQKVAAYFLTSNTTRSSISWKDANEYGVNSGNRYNYNSETDSWEVNDNFISSEDGFPLVFKTGAFYSGQVTDKLKIGANYSYSDFRKTTKTTSRSQFFLPDTSYSNSTESTSNSRFMGHEANLSFVYKIDSLQTLTIEPKFSFSKRNNTNSYLSDYLNSDDQLSRNSTNTSTSSNEATNIKAHIKYNKKFIKPKRELKIVNNFISDLSNSNGNQLYSDYFAQTSSIKNAIDQQKKSDRTILSNVLAISYTEPFSKKWSMEFSYELFNTTNQQLKNSYNFNQGNYDILDTTTSGDFKSVKMQNKLGLIATYEFKNHTVKLGAVGRNVLTDNQNIYTQTIIKQNQTAVLPRFTYTYKISKNSRFRWGINTNSILPDINYLQPTTNNNDPNYITIGNPNLKPNYLISSDLNYNIYNPLSGGYLWTSFYTAYAINQFISTKNYDSIGRSINSYINGNTLNYLGGSISGGIPIVKQVLTLEPEFGYQYGNRFNYVNNNKNKLLTHSLSPSIRLNLEADIVEFNVGFNYNYSLNKNSINSEMNLVNQTYGISSELSVYLPYGMNISTDIDYKNYRELSDGYNVKPFIWNASIEQTLGKNKQWGLKIEAYDLLNKNVKINRSANANIITDSRTAIISRYFLLHLSYKFNSTFKSSKKTTKDNE
ncbi:MAG: outer membrane beta-barrel protein [Crocinitomicaceae bacterium]|nr:outer membrane beta-barrel protein [Crocinitomicaceae bacterium]